MGWTVDGVVIGTEELWSNQKANQLTEVGKTKSLGYVMEPWFGLQTGIYTDDIRKYAKDNNLECVIKVIDYFSPKDTEVVYLVDVLMLTKILKENKDDLKSAEVPTINYLDYIDYITYNNIEQEDFPKAYRAIGLTFNDERFRN